MLYSVTAEREASIDPLSFEEPEFYSSYNQIMKLWSIDSELKVFL